MPANGDLAGHVASQLGKAVRDGTGWKCKCPTHDDHDPSLGLSVDEDGKLLWFCRARKCSQQQVGDELKRRGLLPEREPRQPRPDKPVRDKLEGVFVYTDEDGTPLYRVHRWRKPDGSKVMPQSRPDGKGGWLKGIKGVRRGVPYHLPELLAAPPAEPVVIVEGEAKVEALAKLGVLATCSSGGADSWTREHARHIGTRPAIVLPDNDSPGHGYARLILATLPHARTVQLPDLPEGGDILDWLKAGGTPEQLRHLLLEGPPVTLLRAPASDRAPATDAAARSRAPAREDDGWKSLLKERGKGYAKLEFNIFVALRHAPELAGKLRLNLLAGRLEHAGMPWSKQPGWTPWIEGDDATLAEWMQGHDIDVRPSQCALCVAAVAREKTFHPVQEYLGGLAWDGVPRLSSWLTTYLGARDAPPEYLHAVGRAWLISLVARAMAPGCKADHILVLEGPQGALKSSALRALMPDESWFTDHVANLGTKDFSQDLRGKWLIELSELSAMGRADIEKVKSALSCQSDHYRPSWGRYSQDFPRGNAFAGTSNSSNYLLDDTGNRRSWGVPTGKIDIAALKRDRAQLWAETLHAYQAREQWWLTAEMEKVAAAEQAKRLEDDPWTGQVLLWAAPRTEPFSIAEVLFQALAIQDAAKHDKRAAIRVGRVLRIAGYVSRHTEHGNLWARPESSSATLSGTLSATLSGDNSHKSDTYIKADEPDEIFDDNTRAHAAAHPQPQPRATSENREKFVSSSAALKSQGFLPDELSPADKLKFVSPPAWAEDWPTWDGRCGADPDCIKEWIALAGGACERRSVTLPASCRQHPAAIKRLLSHIALQAWKVDWT
jgi:hypothetical protein